MFTIRSILADMTSTIKSLAQAARHDMLLAVRCRGCGHCANFLAADVAKFANSSRPLEAIRFVCSECDGRDIAVLPSQIDRDRARNILVWRPVRLK
ncbi:hypothetical protein LXM94_00700 [Rhizobium sp. TRM95111]|uniref:hypothetical protein n=1 Tax=Rhizobium alarense TaxID=2846851 RepID=UPI001F1F1B0F|nr:hypothetical protein [Rhizobium alarense]MCF3638486.1 hypothetical protein [Rhizobium alarense]